MISPLRPRSFVLVASIIIVGAIGYKQYGPGSSKSTSGNAASPIGIEVTPFSVMVENKAGMSLFDVRVSIVPASRTTLFSSFQGRMDSSEKREFAFTSFSGRDGTPFNLRVVRARSVKVTAQDMNGKPYEVEVPWP